VEIADFMVQQFGAFLASHAQDAQHGASVKPCEAFTGTDASSLTQQGYNLTGLLEIHPQIVQWQLFRE
jgi:hypothetical protein